MLWNIISRYTDLYGLKWKRICCHHLPLSSLMGYRLCLDGNHSNFTQSQDEIDEIIAILAGTKTPKEPLRSTLLWNTGPEGPACSLRPGHCGYGAAVAPEETGKDAQDDENNAMAQKHLQVVFAADIEEAAAFELLNNLCHSSPEKLNFYDCSQIPSSAWQKLRGASWTNLREVNFRGCLVLQTWLRCLASSFRRRVYFSLLRAIVTAVSLTTFDNIERPEMWNRQLQIVGTCKSHLQRGAATDCHPFIDSSDKISYLFHPFTWHIVIFSRLPKPLRCAIAIYAEFHKQHRHLKRCQEPVMCHLVG